MARKQKTGTKQMLADSMKALMLDCVNFDKMTIKDITDRAGLIRPTFYNHFQDKYELLEWIFFEEIIRPSYVLVDTGMVYEALQLIFVSIRSDSVFMAEAYRVTGQNAFEAMVFDSFRKWMLRLYERDGGRLDGDYPIWMQTENLAYYYANNLAFIVKMWNEEHYATSVDDMMGGINYLSNHTFSEMVPRGKLRN